MKINSFDVVDITNKYGTPLYIYDIDKVKENIKLYKDNFKSDKFLCEVAYASKAFSILPFIKLVKEENLKIDVVSIGEARTAVMAGFRGSEVYLHGNNKTIEELMYAFDYNFTIVVDNLEELKLIIGISMGKKINILLRLNFGIEAHTHKYIITGNLDSKFGIIYNSIDYKEALDLIDDNENINLLGFHSHIGSQIFELEPYYALIDKYEEISKEFDKKLVFSLGGGFGVKYIDSDKPIPLDIVSKSLISYVESKNMKIEKLVIEPGRSIVSEAGFIAYSLGFKKQTPNKLYYFVDGGMSDNIRPALYQAKYRAVIAGKEEETNLNKVTIGGKCCESGDILAEDIMLPDYKYGDILVFLDCGAYSFQMSSNYNKLYRPGVVFVDNKKFELVVKRQDIEDLA